MKEYQLKKRSLKFQIMAFSLVIVLSLGLTSGILMQKMISTSKDVSIEDFKSRAISLQGAVAAQFYERYGDVQAFAINPSITSLDKSKIVPLLNQYAVLYGIYDLILVVDTEGHLIAANDISPEKTSIQTQSLYLKNYKDEPWFKSVIEEKFTNDKEHNLQGTFAEDPQFDLLVKEAYGRQSYGSGFSAPIKDSSGKVIGVISNRAGSRWFEGDFVDLSHAMKQKGVEEFKITMLDKSGVVLIDFDSSDLSIKHDEQVLGKQNLAKEGLTPAKELINKKLGSGIFINSSNQASLVTGYSPIDNHKFALNLGWGIMIRANEELVFKKINTVESLFYISTFLIVLMALFVSYRVSTSITNNLQQISENLSSSGGHVGAAATQIATASEQLSQATTEQAASLQETSSTIEEISSMVNANTENAKQSSFLSEKSLATAEKGKIVVEQMIFAIAEINSSNEGIVNQINDTNKQSDNIIKIINEIGSKTKVINDIVFQTKLLSFNASVEAARAGEHGKGFAVVAEEVGNLAAMSGSAALEISNMLDSGIRTIEGIIRDSKNKIDKLIVTGKDKVEVGTQVAHECESVLNEILISVANVSKLASEISTASQEQALGVDAITKAIAQLDQVTHQNTANSAESANAAAALSQQADGLISIVRSLVVTINGGVAIENKNDSVSAKENATSKKNKKDNRFKKSVSVAEVKVKKNPELFQKEAQKSLVSSKESVIGSGLPGHDDSRFEDV
jgi:methyl-accepting chemotaxis protein